MTLLLKVKSSCLHHSLWWFVTHALPTCLQPHCLAPPSLLRKPTLFFTVALEVIFCSARNTFIFRICLSLFLKSVLQWYQIKEIFLYCPPSNGASVHITVFCNSGLSSIIWQSLSLLQLIREQIPHPPASMHCPYITSTPEGLFF